MEHAKRWQVIYLDEVSSKLKILSNQHERMSYLSVHYPSLYVFILDRLGMKDEIEKYMVICKQYEND